MVKSKKNKIVCNSSPIINLSKINRLDLIEKIYKQIIIPCAVFDELVVKGNTKDHVSEIKSLIDIDVIIVKKVKNLGLINLLRKDLDYGESEAIALAQEIKADLIILDEKDARDIASIYDLKKTGFLGILIKAKEKGFVNSVKENIDLAINEGFWIDDNLYNFILTKIDEE